jgi:hypothetical protein
VFTGALGLPVDCGSRATPQSISKPASLLTRSALSLGRDEHGKADPHHGEGGMRVKRTTSCSIDLVKACDQAIQVDDPAYRLAARTRPSCPNCSSTAGSIPSPHYERGLGAPDTV